APDRSSRLAHVPAGNRSFLVTAEQPSEAAGGRSLDLTPSPSPAREGEQPGIDGEDSGGDPGPPLLPGEGLGEGSGLQVASVRSPTQLPGCGKGESEWLPPQPRTTSWSGSTESRTACSRKPCCAVSRPTSAGSRSAWPTTRPRE